MNFTPDILRQNAAAMEAHSQGRPVQFWNTMESIQPKWLDIDKPCWSFDYSQYRPKPKPEPPQPWDCAEDVPGPVCWIHDERTGEYHIVTGVTATGLWALSGFVSFPLATVWKHSTDRKEWKPCTKN